ncbi:MAG: hypothetical protein K5765_05630, partial [Clostridia bacterium]|nr:hypothetical protein [Clostridia bacterium]
IRNSNSFKRFDRNIKNGAINHAYLLISPDKECRDMFFELACMSILCPNKGCGVCSTCQKIKDDCHTEIIKADGDGIKIDEIEHLLNMIDIKPVDSAKKIVYLDNGERIPQRLQNKLLKVYEEPPSYIVFFIGSSKEQGIIQTIKSRAQKVYIDLLSSDQIINELVSEGVDRQDAISAAAASVGSLEKARKLCTDERYKGLFNDTFDMFINLKKSFEVPDYVFLDLFNKDNILITLDFMEIILGDVLKIINNLNVGLSIVGRDFDLRELASTFSNASLSYTIELIEKGRQDLLVNVKSSSVAEMILLGMLEAKYIWKLK